MQKKIIALAVAGLVSGAAFAQSNVTIYGVADAGYVYSSGERQGTLKNNANFNGINSGILSGSRLGFKGQEDLGNGLKAVFTLEYALTLDANDGIGETLARQQWVGLKSDKLGQFALGRQYAPGHGASVRADVIESSSTASPLLLLETAAGMTIQSSSNARINNSVTYTSPKMAGFTVSAIYGFSENGSSATTASNGVSAGDDGIFGLGLNYANGGLNLDAVYHYVEDRTSAGPVAAIAAIDGVPAVAASASTRDPVKEWIVAGSYDFKVAKVMATYQDRSDDNGTNAQDSSSRLWSVGAIVPVFPKGAIRVCYANLNWDRNNAGESDAWMLGYTHGMSKRTTLYTTYTSVDNDKNALVAAGNSNTAARGERNGTFTAGIRHTF